MTAGPGGPTRRVWVQPERLSGWLQRFSDRHGEAVVSVQPERVAFAAADGSTAAVAVPFPPLPVGGDPVEALIRHATKPRLLGVLLVRRGGYAVGVLRGPDLMTSKVGSRHVQGKTKAGGWSQQRFARRRANQADAAFAAAADTAVGFFAEWLDRLDGMVLGGDRAALTAVLADDRLAALAELPVTRRLAVPDPRLRVLRAEAPKGRAVAVDVHDVQQD